MEHRTTASPPRPPAAILTAKVAQLYPLASPSKLVSKFFFLFNMWTWPYDRHGAAPAPPCPSARVLPLARQAVCLAGERKIVESAKHRAAAPAPARAPARAAAAAVIVVPTAARCPP